MAIGTGIFLGLAILAVVLLYTQTKDRWRWGRIAKWTAAVIATPIVIGAGWFAYEALQDYLRSRPRLAMAYADIALGDSMAEVRYAKGMPTDVMEEDVSPEGLGRGWLVVTRVADLPEGRAVTDYLHWSYDKQYTGRIVVEFSPVSKRVDRVSCYSSEGRSCEALAGIYSGKTEVELLEGLGKPSASEIDADSPVKTIRYSQFNATYLLEERRVYGLTLEDETRFAADRADATARLTESSARELPPCKSGANSCKPWERDWKVGDKLPKGATVSE